jgi:replicative DNA helicase
MDIDTKNFEVEAVKAQGDVAAEASLLGAIMVNNRTIEQAEYLKPEHFVDPRHGEIFATCRALSDSEREINALSIARALNSPEGLLQYLAEVSRTVPSVKDAAWYAELIKDWHVKRQAKALLHEASEALATSDLSAEAMETLEQGLYDLSANSTMRGFKSMGEVVDMSLAQAERAYKADGALLGVTTGFKAMDTISQGLNNSDLVILAARPAMGKTALAIDIATNAAKSGVAVGVFSLEMSAEQLGTRMLSSVSRVPQEQIRTGMMKSNDMQKIIRSKDHIAKLPIHIDDNGLATVSMIRTKARRMKRQHDIGLIVIDYLQLMAGAGENRQQEITQITRGLKLLAKDLNIPVLVLSQLSRNVEQRENKRPQLSDLRESGAIEQDADVVMFLYREAYYHANQAPEQGTEEFSVWAAKGAEIERRAEVIYSKQRHGSTGTAYLEFNGELVTFENAENRYG